MAYKKDLNRDYCEMQHRHFRTIAAIINKLPAETTRTGVTQRFAQELQSTNPNFDMGRFISACLNDD